MELKPSLRTLYGRYLEMVDNNRIFLIRWLRIQIIQISVPITPVSLDCSWSSDVFERHDKFNMIWVPVQSSLDHLRLGMDFLLFICYVSYSVVSTYEFEYRLIIFHLILHKISDTTRFKFQFTGKKRMSNT